MRFFPPSISLLIEKYKLFCLYSKFWLSLYQARLAEIDGPVGLVPSSALEEKRKSFVNPDLDYSKSSLCKILEKNSFCVFVSQNMSFRRIGFQYIFNRFFILTVESFNVFYQEGIFVA